MYTKTALLVKLLGSKAITITEKGHCALAGTALLFSIFVDHGNMEKTLQRTLLYYYNHFLFSDIIGTVVSAV